MLSPFRLSVVCLWRWCTLPRSFKAPCTLLSRLKFLAIFLRRLVPTWLSIDIQWKFYGDRPRGTPPSGDLTQEGWRNIAISDISNAITPKRCKIGGKLVLMGAFWNTLRVLRSATTVPFFYPIRSDSHRVLYQNTVNSKRFCRFNLTITIIQLWSNYKFLYTKTKLDIKRYLKSFFD